MTSELVMYVLCDEVNGHDVVTTLPGDDDVSIPKQNQMSRSGSTQQREACGHINVDLRLVPAYA